MLISFLPAGIGDCALLQFAGGAFNILVDAGPSKPGDTAQRLIEHLQRLLPNGLIDIAIITHHDDDHIGGFMGLFAADSPLRIDQLIFNAPALVRMFLSNSTTQKCSPRQGYLIGERKRPRHHEVVTAGQRIPCFGDQVELVFLSPTPELVRRYGKLVDSSQPVKISARKPFRPYAELKQEEDRFSEDTSRSNALSLAFEVRFGARTWLFLGDAWPSTVTASLDQLYGEDKPAYELVKLSHHGSDGNTSAELLARFSCLDYVVPTNGQRHHPQAQALRRVLDACADSPPRFHFPARTVELEHLLKAYGDYVVYPQADELLQFPD
ncbi:MBL fold metallo-hydrolase [Pseudomonas sp. 148P]|uniref:MBL fold metallo-hydrolase n=1 Tax=Pseudomonas ulcerans TaxID=3115852 RepID=A0ABU7I2A3_9PSED|nr:MULTISPECIES: MBL fold metallo-hydrolase [unclassified Pseudomonas]MEE1926551.1 MBL fold metallo-hydrolase [Pseudomonas sp. 147P]MEE1937788.1 MBL fold metallo-hydrolase [Pseudomonas sp. 148P]